ncbi:MAG: PIG-L family deacetylase [Mycobacteriales bacterium]
MATTSPKAALTAAAARSRNSLGRLLPSSLRTKPRRLMFLHAHPDDESSKGAATMAELVAQGHQVMVVTCTGGQQGSILNPHAGHLAAQDISELRRTEMAGAVGHLGVQHRWLGYPDSGMTAEYRPAKTDGFAFQTEPATSDLANVIREFKPDVLVTYNETGGYPHPDHIATHQVSHAAVRAAADVWQVPKVYYHVPPDAQTVVAAHWALLARGRPSPFGPVLKQWRMHPQLDPGRRVTTRVAASLRSAKAARQAALAHVSQVSPDCLALVLPDWARKVENFERVVPPPQAGKPVERSLLAGLTSSGRRDWFRSLRRRTSPAEDALLAR